MSVASSSNPRRDCLAYRPGSSSPAGHSPARKVVLGSSACARLGFVRSGAGYELPTYCALPPGRDRRRGSRGTPESHHLVP